MARRPRGPAARPAKVERKYTLTLDAARRLDVHALALGRRPAELLEELIVAHLRRYHLTDRGEDGVAGVEGPRRGQNDEPTPQSRGLVA